jgi:hypothetical protein
MIKPKIYLREEGQRNRRNAALYDRIVRLVFGADNAVITGHHINFQLGGDIETENEIPAADTLLFDHDVMTELLGADATEVMQTLAGIRPEFREEYLDSYLDMMGIGTSLAPPKDERTIPSRNQLDDLVASPDSPFKILEREQP